MIIRRVALLDQKKLGLGTTAFVSIQVGAHSSKDLARFATNVAAMEEVTDFYRMAGDVDYFLRVVVEDTAALDAFDFAFYPRKHQIRNRSSDQRLK